MYEYCIENFLKKSDPTHIERHSDSSDFENPNDIDFVTSQFDFHTLQDETRYDIPERDYNVYHASSKNKKYDNNTKSNSKDREHLIKHRKPKSKVKQQQQQQQQQQNEQHRREPVPKRRLEENDTVLQRKNKNSGDQSSLNLTKWCYSKSIIRDKVIPRLSTIFRRTHNKPVVIIEEDSKTKKPRLSKETCCPYCKRERLSKKRQRKVIPLHPVYAVNQNIHTFPIPYSLQPVSMTKINSTRREDFPDQCFENNYCSSDSEIEIINRHQVKKHKDTTKERIQYERRNDSIIEKNIVRSHQQQQFPSKTQLKSPCQVYTSAACQARSDLNLDSSPSVLWNLFKDKIQIPEIMKPCYCRKGLTPCSPETCKNLNDIVEKNLSKFKEKLSNESVPSSSSIKKELKTKKHRTSKCVCKCYGDKKEKKPETSDAETQQEEEKICQENHDKIADVLTQKYNGEILCIHNPPCVLINGCLNLPPPKIEVQGNLWPVTQNKKSGFVQMCRKIKRTKDIKPAIEQSSQYHPPFSDIKQCLPEFVTEKVIQSVCNHNPPCEVVHGCYKAKYDPRLQNSCIHVPSCNKVPQCLLGTQSIENNYCIHKPKCPEIPLCSRKYILLTAKENASTQIQPQTKICRHEPPCFMIPKCLANAIYGDCIPVGAIPGCTHKPSCEMIPACCRKSAKEMVSVPSQYPNTPCRIV